MHPWICHQLGSREHYSIPRALHKKNCLRLLQTDAWVRPPAQWLPRLLGQKALAARYHDQLADAEVNAFTLRRLSFDIFAKIRKQSEWSTIAQRDLWFQKKCLPTLNDALSGDQRTIVFSYAYTALELFKAAKERGATCILGQVDPGPAEMSWLAEVLPSSIIDQIEDRSAALWARWRKEIELADKIIVNSAWSKELLVSRADVPAGKITILPLAYERPKTTNTEHSYPLQFSKDRPLRMLFLGQLLHRKGVHLLLEAMEAFRDQPVILDLVGPLVMDIGSLPVNVTQHGPVDASTAQKFYTNADVFCLPTLSDGFALTQLEAAGHRLPLIVSRHCAAVCQDDQNGLVLDEVSADSIGSAIQHCLEHPEDLRRWSAYELDWDTYSIDKLGSGLLAIAHEVSGSPTLLKS